MHMLLHQQTTENITLHFFRQPHIKVKNATEDKVKYEVNSGQWSYYVVTQNSTKW